MRPLAFVTGGTGFVGLNLIRHLVQEGWAVTSLCRPTSDREWLSDLAVDWIEGDVTDLRTWDGAVPAQPDAVFHVAGNTQLWSRHRSEQLKVHVKGTRNVVKVALDAGARRLIHVSSLAAFGLHSGLITEETPSRGSRSSLHYVRSKALAEREIARGRSAGLSTVTFNPGHLLGRYDTHNWSRLFRLVQQRRLPAMPPGGASFAHVGEAVRVMTVAALHDKPQPRYVLGGAQLTYTELLRQALAVMDIKRRVWSLPVEALHRYAQCEEWMATLFGREPEITREAVSLLSGNLYCNSRLAQQDLGYRPVTISTMLSEAWGWWRKHAAES
jgi:dihydroflavonol-4-reductase